MPQANGYQQLKRFKLEIIIRGQSYYYNFLINPENYTETHPQRVTAFKTREASVVEDFGPDLGKIQFSGTTGFRRVRDADGRIRDGAGRLKELEQTLKRYAESGRTTEPNQNPNTGVMFFYNQTDDKSWRVTLDNDGLEIERSAEESLLYRYSLSLIVLDTADNPDPREIDSPAVGSLIEDYDNYVTGTENANAGERYQSGTMYEGADAYDPYSSYNATGTNSGTYVDSHGNPVNTSSGGSSTYRNSGGGGTASFTGGSGAVNSSSSSASGSGGGARGGTVSTSASKQGSNTSNSRWDNMKSNMKYIFGLQNGVQTSSSSGGGGAR